MSKPNNSVVAIIGCAGRGSEGDRMTKALYERMIQRAALIIENTFRLPSASVQLLSGGAAWSDHLAVELFLTGKFAGLTLAMPCAWDVTHREFDDTGEYDWKRNPGRSTNQYHRHFSKKLGRNSLYDIQTAINRGADMERGEGFHARNRIVASTCDYMIAFSWAENASPHGGTGYTWKQTQTSHKVHVPLSTLVKELTMTKK